jgi:hypothetical protein
MSRAVLYLVPFHGGALQLIGGPGGPWASATTRFHLRRLSFYDYSERCAHIEDPTRLEHHALQLRAFPRSCQPRVLKVAGDDRHLLTSFAIPVGEEAQVSSAVRPG